MQPQLAAIVGALESARTRLHRLTDSLPEARWEHRPGRNSWSAAECVEHLNLTSQAYVPRLRHALESAPPSARDSKARYRRDFLGWLFSTIVGPLPRVGGKRIGKVKTSPAFVPEVTTRRAQIVAEFDRLQDELIAISRQADGFPLGTMKIISPFGERIRYNFYSALRILPRHQERHLAQAEEAATART